MSRLRTILSQLDRIKSLPPEGGSRSSRKVDQDQVKLELPNRDLSRIKTRSSSRGRRRLKLKSAQGQLTSKRLGALDPRRRPTGPWRVRMVDRAADERLATAGEALVGKRMGRVHEAWQRD